MLLLTCLIIYSPIMTSSAIVGCMSEVGAVTGWDSSSPCFISTSNLPPVLTFRIVDRL